MLKKKINIEYLIEEGEGQTLDFKFNINDSRKIARSLVAFANTDGGSLLIGVRDNGSIAGVHSDEELFMIELAAHKYCKPEVQFEVQDWQISNKTILEIKVRASETKPHYAFDEFGKSAAYIRVKDQNFLANKVLIKVWERQIYSEGTLLKFRKKEKNCWNT